MTPAELRIAPLWLAACSGGDPTTPPPAVAVEPSSIPETVDCANLDDVARPLTFTLAEVVAQSTGTTASRVDPALSAAMREASGERIRAKSSEGLERAGLVLSFGLRTPDARAAEAVGERLGQVLDGLRIPGAVRTHAVACAPFAALDGETAACFDAFVLMPYVVEQRRRQASVLMQCGWLGTQLRADAAIDANLVYAEAKGMATGEDAGRLFSVRRMLAEPAPAAAPPIRLAQAPAAKSVATKAPSSGLPPVTVDRLVWTDATTTTTKEKGYEQRVLAPGFTGVAGSAGTWALVGLGARVGDGKFRCLRGTFRNVVDPSQRVVVDSGDCSSIEKYVELDAGRLATAVSIKISDNTVKGVGLGSGTPNDRVDPVFPDFLTGVSSSSFVFSGSSGVCGGTCDAYCESCQVSKNACEAGCCYGCSTGKWCSCNYGCGAERDKCYEGCTRTFTGSAKVDVRRVTGLENGTFTGAALPFVTEAATVGLETTFEVAGLTAPTYWRLCQSGVCVSDTTPIESSKMKVRASASVQARACPSGPPALYMSLALLEIVEPGLWNIEDFARSVVKVVDDSMDWLAANLTDLFEVKLQDDFEELVDRTLETLRNELNATLSDLPVFPCQS